jgi:ornithine cyclodeaminase
VTKGEILVVNQREVERLLPMAECIEAMAEAFTALARGGAIQPLRSIVWLPGRKGALGLMPGALPAIAGLKAVTFFPGNEGTELDSHQGAVLLFEAERGQLLAILDATSITAIRTAAVSGLATRLLAREDAGDLALIGSGVQARTHLDAMGAVRTLRRVRVFSRDADAARAFAERESRRREIRVEPVGSAREAVAGADLVCTVTSARDPVVKGEWIAAGAHINAVGSSQASARELDTAAAKRSRLFVDRRESAMAEAGEYVLAKSEGAVGAEHIRAEIGDILIGKARGRESRDEITLFKSVGLAIEDLAAARLVFDKASAAGAGTAVALGGLRR